MSDTACAWPWATPLGATVFHNLWLPLLGVGGYCKDQPGHQGWLIPGLASGVVQQMSQRSQMSASTCWLSVRLCYWKRLHRMNQEGFLWMELLLFPRLMLHVGKCCAWEKWLLQYGEWFRAGILAADPSALFQESPTPDSSHVSNLFCPPSSKDQGKWLQTKFCALAI